ncbi:MAG: hypothetical protein ACRC8W_14140, partial [Plesiomonas shigelloides]
QANLLEETGLFFYALLLGINLAECTNHVNACLHPEAPGTTFFAYNEAQFLLTQILLIIGLFSPESDPAFLGAPV